MNHKPIVILGAGMAGFGAAYRLELEGVSSVLYEKKAHHGGHTASYAMNGFVFDEGPHISFTKNERIRELFAASVDQQYETVRAQANNYWRGHWIKHPTQCNLYGLPHELVVKIIADFVTAQHAEPGEIRTYEDWLLASFGRTFAETFPMEYGLKFHTTTSANMTTDWIGPRLYRADLEEVLRGALSPSTPDVHYISDFRYPSRNGFGSYLNRFLEATKLVVDHQVVRIEPDDGRLHFANGTEGEYGSLISSVPLPELIPMIAGVPEDVLAASRRLACTEAIVVTLGIAREDVSDAHWTYFYDPDVFFTRLSTPHLQSPHNVPPGCSSLQAECYYSGKYRPLDRTPEACIEPVVRDLIRCGVLREDDEIVFKHALHLPYANVIFDHDRNEALTTVQGYLQDVGIIPCGRYGEWAYIWTDQAFVSGENAAQQILDGAPTRPFLSASA